MLPVSFKTVIVSIMVDFEIALLEKIIMEAQSRRRGLGELTSTFPQQCDSFCKDE